MAKEALKFGVTTSDHMLEVDWDVSGGWGAPRITPYAPFALDPACTVFHYGLAAFEGMKAYRDVAGRGVRLFRPALNMARLGRSMARLALGPPGAGLDEPGFLAAIAALTKEEASWVPSGEGYSLYLRPTVIGTQAALGVGPSTHLKLFTIACPVGPYYPSGFKPVSIYAERAAVRAWPGGVGDIKAGGNYAPTIAVQAAAGAKGYAQVLWLFGEEEWVTEVGTMNLFVVWRGKGGGVELITAPLDGTILPGVTRDSILALARGWGECTVSERKFTMGELVEALGEGRVLEVFGAGTAAVVSPVKEIAHGGKVWSVPLDPKDASAGAGPWARRIWRELADIQYGVKEHEWSVLLPGTK